MPLRESVCGLRLAGLVLLIVAMLVGCADSDPVNPPAELVDLETPIKIGFKWRNETTSAGNFSGYQFQSLILDDVVLVIDRRGQISALDREEGYLVWSFLSGLKAGTGLARAGQLIIATSLDGVVVAYRRQPEGLEAVWRVTTDSEIRVPAVSDGNLVLVRGVDGKLYALDAENGDQRWVVARRVPALSLTGGSVPLIDGDVIYSGYEDGKIIALDRGNGEILWERSISTPTGRTEVDRLRDIDGNFMLRNSVLYVATFQGQLAALQSGNGELLWSREFSSFLPMDADGSALYLVSEDSHIWSIDRRTGSALWKQEGLRGRKLTAPLLQDGRIIVSDFEGYVHWLDASDGAIIGRRKALDGRSYVQPQALDDAVLVSDVYGITSALQAAGDAGS